MGGWPPPNFGESKRKNVVNGCEEYGRNESKLSRQVPYCIYTPGITVISREMVFKQFSVLKLLHFGNILQRFYNPKIPTTKQQPTPLKRPGIAQCIG